MTEKILQEEILSDDELEKVSGGDEVETFYDGYELYRRGILSEKDSENYDLVRKAIHEFGYKYIGYSGMDPYNWKYNKYFNKKGDSITRDQFWDNFDAENGTKIIR